MILNPNIWFNYFKFIMITISLYYPKYPNDVTKKKYSIKKYISLTILIISILLIINFL